MTHQSQDTSPFHISTATQDGRQVVVPEGELDLTTAPQLEERLTHTLTEGDTVLELSRISFIDSSGIALLVSISTAAREHGWNLELRNPSAHVDRLIKLTGVAPLLGSPEE